VDVLVIGNAEKSPKNLSFLEDTGHSVFREAAATTNPLFSIQPVRRKSPARYEYYRQLITNRPGAKLPRSKAIKMRSRERLVAINMPSL
jgi:hypothetical protein